MTQFMTQRQFSGKGGRPGFRSKRQAQGTANKLWKCCACRAEYSTKPKTCHDAEWGCGGKAFWYFASRKECQRARTLLGSLDRGEIRNLEFQVPYPLNTVDMRTGKPVPTGRKYVADSRYERLTDGEWVQVVEDVKPGSAAGDDEVFKLKLAIVEASYGIKVRLVRKV